MLQRLIALATSALLITTLSAGAPARASAVVPVTHYVAKNGFRPITARTIMTKRFDPNIPIALPLPQSTEPGPITFSNVLAHVDEIPKAAWDNVQEELAAGGSGNLSIKLFIGPTTQTTSAQVAELIQRQFRLFEGFRQPRKLVALAYNATDLRWAEGEWRKIVKSQRLRVKAVDYLDALRAGCTIGVECSGGMSLGRLGNDTSVIFYGVQEPFWTKEQQSAGPMAQVLHEYTHEVQFAQWLGATSAVQSWRSRSFPCWWSEGQANAIGIPITASSFDAYKRVRDYNVTRPFNVSGPKPSLKTFSATAIEAFLKQKPQTCYRPDTNGDYQLGYSVGYAAVETLVAIGGARATMAVIARTSAGDTWATAFKKVYGINWARARSVLASVLAEEYARMPLRSE